MASSEPLRQTALPTTGLARVRSSALDLLGLTKPRLSSLVLLTAAGGMLLAPGNVGWAQVCLAMLAIAGVVASANALNCYLERDTDRFMLRTRNRPLPSGRMEPAVALGFGAGLAAVSLPALAVGVNLLTGLLGLLAFVSYVAIYTPLKRKSPLAVLVGAVPGALPPLMGWTAVSGSLDRGGVALFLILFLWQMPHFIAIGMFRKSEYTAAGLRMVPEDRPDAAARAQILAYLVVLVPVTVLPYALGLAGAGYLWAACALGAAFLGFGLWGFFRRLGASWARHLFASSIVYLAGLFLALALSRPG